MGGADQAILPGFPEKWASREDPKSEMGVNRLEN